MAVTVQAEDWVRYRGPNLNGISSEVDWSDAWGNFSPTTLWRAHVGTGLSGVVTSQGRLVTLGNTDERDTIYCLDMQTGETLWQHSYPAASDPNEFEGGPTSTPTIAEGRVYVLSRHGDVLCLNATDGQVNWHVNAAELAAVRVPTWGFAGSPLVLDGRLLLNVGDAGTALDPLTGQLLWSSADRDAGYSSLVPLQLNGQPAVVLGSARSYVCIDPTDGHELWRQRWLTTFGCNAADPLVRGEQLFLSSGYNRGSALLQATWESVAEIWKSKEMQNQISSSVLIDEYLYGIHGDVNSQPELRCLRWATGELMWQEDSFRPGGLIAAGRRLIVLSDDGELLIVATEPQACRLLARQRVLSEKCWTAPTLSNGKIFCRSVRGELVCVQLSQP